MAWNEGRTVRTARDLAEGRENVIEIPLSAALQNSGDMTLIHTSGTTSTNDIISDPVFGVSASSLGATGSSFSNSSSTPALVKLSRSIEIYQWQERTTSTKRNTAGGGTRTTTEYSYSKGWSSSLADSDSFGPSGNNEPIYWNGELVENPDSIPFTSDRWTADPIFLGDLTLSTSAVSRLNDFETVTAVSISDVPDASLQADLTDYNSGRGLYYGNGTNSQPQVGDLRLSWAAVPTSTISVIGEVSTSNELASWTTSRMGELLLVDSGVRTSGEMFQKAEDANTALAWVLRVAGFVAMTVSFVLMLQPLSTALDIIPFVGNCIGDGMESCLFPIIGCIISLPLSGLIIAVAWSWHRPLFAVPFVAVCAALMCFFCYRAYNKQGSSSDDGSYQGQPPSYPPKPTYNEQEAEIPVAAAQPMSYQAQTGYVPTATAAPVGAFSNALDK